MEKFEKNDKRTHYCGTLTKENLGQQVCVLGWAQKQRDLGSLIFIDLRDRTGIVQLAFDDNTAREAFDKAFTVRAEFVLCAKGVVRARGEGAVCPAGCLKQEYFRRRRESGSAADRSFQDVQVLSSLFPLVKKLSLNTVSFSIYHKDEKLSRKIVFFFLSPCNSVLRC